MDEAIVVVNKAIAEKEQVTSELLLAYARIGGLAGALTALIAACEGSGVPHQAIEAARAELAQ